MRRGMPPDSMLIFARVLDIFYMENKSIESVTTAYK